MTAPAISHDSRVAIKGNYDGVSILKELPKGVVIRELSREVRTPSAIEALSWAGEDYLLSGYDDGSIDFWNLTKGIIASRFHEHKRKINAIAARGGT